MLDKSGNTLWDGKHWDLDGISVKSLCERNFGQNITNQIIKIMSITHLKFAKSR